MKHRHRWLLLLSLATFATALWFWLRPYQWWPDSRAAARIEWASVTRDHSYRWLDLRLALKPAGPMPEPLELKLADGRTVRPDQVSQIGTGRASDDPLGARLAEIEAIDLRFWLEDKDLAGPLTLKIGPGELVVRSSGPTPALEETEIRRFRSSRW